MLGPTVELRTDSPEFVAQVESRLGRFLVDAPPDELIEVRLGASPPALLDGGRLTVLDEGAAAEQAFSLLFRGLIDRIADHLLLHGAALAARGRTWLISGPSGSGKTTLALALVGRGLRLLSDDYCPLEIDSGLLLPFHKAPGIRAGEAERLSTQLANRPGAGPLPPELLGEGALCHEPSPLGGVVLLGAAPFEAGAPYAFSVTFLRPPTAEQIAAFVSLEGVGLADVEGCELVLSVNPRRGAAAGLEAVIEREAGGILEYGTVASVDHGRGDPVARMDAMDRSSAVLALAREVQNRRRGSALAQRLGGDPSRLVSIIAGAIGEIPCWSLGGGSPEQRADAVLRAIAEG